MGSCRDFSKRVGKPKSTGTLKFFKFTDRLSGLVQTLLGKGRLDLNLQVRSNTLSLQVDRVGSCKDFSKRYTKYATYAQPTGSLNCYEFAGRLSGLVQRLLDKGRLSLNLPSSTLSIFEFTDRLSGLVQGLLEKGLLSLNLKGRSNTLSLQID